MSNEDVDETGSVYERYLSFRRRYLEAEAEIVRLRAALELIAGSASDKLQAMQARCALDNIGPKVAGR
jgi:hypothetical protein